MSTIDWRTLFVSADGRLARTPFWIAAAILLALWGLYESLTGATTRLVTGWLFYPLLIFFGVCVLAKRFHDRGRSGWFAAPVIVALIGAWPWPRTPLDLLFVGIIVWAAIELGGLSGEQGANRYGANPIRHAYG